MVKVTVDGCTKWEDDTIPAQQENSNIFYILPSDLVMLSYSQKVRKEFLDFIEKKIAFLAIFDGDMELSERLPLQMVDLTSHRPIAKLTGRVTNE